MKNWVLAVVFGLGGAAMAIPAAAQSAGGDFQGIAAIVNDYVVTRQEVLRLAMRPMVTARLRFSKDAEYMVEANRIYNDNLNLIVERHLIVSEFKEKGYALPDSLSDDLVKSAIREDFGGDRLNLTKTLHAEHKTIEEFKREQMEQFIVAQMTLKNLKQELIISPKKIENYYKTNMAAFQVGERVKLRMIIIDPTKHSPEESRKIAKDVVTRARAGEDFAALAEKYSEDARRSKGGDRDWVENKESELRKELREVAFKMKPGEISDVIEIGRTEFVLKVEDRKAPETKSLSEVRQQIESELRQSEGRRLRAQWIERLRKKAYVRMF
jgi:peptidyl-prolyl cis-trans isomerase SurA